MDLTYFSQEPLCPWLSLPSVPPWVGLPALTVCMNWVLNVQLSQESLPGALWERMLWVEIVSFNLSRLEYLISIVCYFLKWAFTSGFQNHFTLTFSWITTFAGTFWGSACSCRGFVVTASQFTDEETEAVLLGGFIYKVRVNVQQMWDEAYDVCLLCFWLSLPLIVLWITSFS